MSVKCAISLDFVVTPSPYSPTTEYVYKHTSILTEGRKFVLNISGDSTFHASEPLNGLTTLKLNSAKTTYCVYVFKKNIKFKQ